jgi:hypothetical protein
MAYFRRALKVCASPVRSDFFTPSIALGHILAALTGLAGRAQIRYRICENGALAIAKPDGGCFVSEVVQRPLEGKRPGLARLCHTSVAVCRILGREAASALAGSKAAARRGGPHSRGLRRSLVYAETAIFCRLHRWRTR